MKNTSNTYKFISTENTLAVVEHELAAAGLTYTRSWGVHTGRKHVVKYTLDVDMLVNGDVVRPVVIVNNSFDKSSAFSIGVGIFRLVCTNGLMVGTAFFHSRIIHRTGQTAEQKLAEIPHKLREAVAYIKTQLVDDIEEVTSRGLTESQMISVLGNLPVPVAVKDRTLRQIVRPEFSRREEDRANNVWTLWNLVNENIRRTSRSGQAIVTHNTNLLRDITDLADDVTTYDKAA